MNIKAWDPDTNTAILPERAPVDGEFYYDEKRKLKTYFFAVELMPEETENNFIGSVEFRDRFTFEERVLLDNSNHAHVVTFIKDLSVRVRPVDLRSPRFASAMTLLLQLELIAVGRDIEIMSNAI